MIPQSDQADVTKTLNGTGTANEGLEPEECLAEIERLVSSSVFLGSDALCKLLRYIAQHTLSIPAEHLKEYQIATEVLDRPADFDPQADSCVRVQMGRLRSKLDQYYESAGAGDTILVSVPKGRYMVTFQRRHPSTVGPPEPESGATPKAKFEAVTEPALKPDTEELTALHASSRRTANLRGIIVASVILVALLLSGGAMTLIIRSMRVTPSGTRSNTYQAPAAIQSFWNPFLSGPQEPFVVFSNADFVGTALNGMRYFDPSRDTPEQLQQHYTGIGEVMGVLALDRLFLQQFGRSFRIKRSGLFTLDDARHNNLIFVGSPTENLTLDEIPNTHEFVFEKLDSGPNRGEQVVVDRHPQPGDSGVFLPTPRGRPMVVDYAVIALMRGLDPSRWTLILGGASTVGTEAAVEYVCDGKSLQELLDKLKIPNGAGMRPFEALLRVRIANDVPLETELVKMRVTE